MGKLYDPKGNELMPTMFQVITSDERGPITMRLRHDDESIGIGSVPEAQRHFYIAYAPKDSTLALTDWSALLQEVEQLRADSEEREREGEAMRAEAMNIKREVDALVDENKKKTEALREMQRERDPERIASQVRIAVEMATQSYETDLGHKRVEVARLHAVIAELKASKKKLKEAYERLKNGRK